MVKEQFDCSNCPALCCSIYQRVEVTDDDLHRLSSYFGLNIEEAEKRFTRKLNGERILRRRKDELLGESCKFLDEKTRRCTMYEARPQACRDFPGTKRCVYYDMLEFERETQETHDVVPMIKLTVYYHDND